MKKNTSISVFYYQQEVGKVARTDIEQVASFDR